MPSPLFDVESSIYRLPSRGIPYRETDLKLIDGDSLKLRPFKAGDQRHLASAGADEIEIYRNFLGRLIVDPVITDFAQLMLSDMMAILFTVRIMSFGPEYSRGYICTTCGALNQERDFTLRELNVRTPDDFLDKDANSIWTFAGIEFTTEEGKVVSFHLPRARDEMKQNEILSNWQTLKLSKKEGEVTDKKFIRLIQLCDTINGAPMANLDKLRFFEDCSLGDFEDMGKLIEDSDVGVIPSLNSKCNSCGKNNEVAVVVTPDFFRPQRKRKEETAKDGIPTDDRSELQPSRPRKHDHPALA